MAKKLKNIEKVAKALGGTIDGFTDGSCSWVLIEDSKHSINICFDGKGDVFTHISVAEKIFQVVDERLIARVKNNKEQILNQNK